MASEAWAALSALGLGLCAAALLERLPRGARGSRQAAGVPKRQGLTVSLSLGMSLCLAAATLGFWRLGPAAFLRPAVAWTAGLAFLLGTAAFRWKLAFGFPLLVLVSIAALALGWLRWGWIPLDALEGPGSREVMLESGAEPGDLLRLGLLPSQAGSWELRVERPGRKGSWSAAGSLPDPKGAAAVVAYRMSFSTAWGIAGAREWLWPAGLIGEAEGQALFLPSAQTEGSAAFSGFRRRLLDPGKAALRLPGLTIERLVSEPLALSGAGPALLCWKGGLQWRAPQ